MLRVKGGQGASSRPRIALGQCFLLIEGGAANEDNGAHRVCTVFLFEGGFEASGARVTVKTERSRLVSDRVSVGENDDRRCCALREKGTNGVLHGGNRIERVAFPEEGRDQANGAGHVDQELALLAYTAT